MSAVKSIRQKKKIIGYQDDYVPMFSASGKEINLGDVLYKSFYSEYGTRVWDKMIEAGAFDDDEDEGTEDEPMFSVPSFRVTQVNYTSRFVLLRNQTGCEITIDFKSDSCPIKKYYHTVEGAKAELQKLLRHKIQSMEQELKMTSRRMGIKIAVFKNDQKRIRVMKVGVPPK